MKLPGKFLLLVFCCSFLLPSIVRAQLGTVDRDAKAKPSFVVLGTYHMGTPGNNVVNGKAVDVSTPERQKQMIGLVEKLERYKPTKVAVECDIEDDAKTQETYEKYLSGTYQLSKNETNQIGFRLAKNLGLKKVYCIDWGIFPDDPLYNYEKYAARDERSDTFLKRIYKNLRTETDKKYRKLSELSITDQLIFVNQPEQIENEHKIYFDLLRIGQGEEYVGANYVSWIYRRNLIIFDNIVRITDSPDDRILVIYGYGHLKLLTQFARESGFYNVESPLRFLNGSDK